MTWVEQALYTTHVWRLEDKSAEPVLSFHFHVSFVFKLVRLAWQEPSC